MSLMTVAVFRSLMPAFTDDTKWPDATVQTAIDEGEAETNPERWGEYADDPTYFRNRGIRYYAAHWLCSFYGSSAADPTSVRPDARQNVSSKSVGDESVAYRITTMEDTGNDWLGTTIYGTQYWRLKKRAGMGALAV